MNCGSPGDLRSLLPPSALFTLGSYFIYRVGFFIFVVLIFFFKNLFFKLGEIFRPCRQDVFSPDKYQSIKLLFATELNEPQFIFAL